MNDIPGRQRLVLVVDDEMVVCDLLRRQLERWNYRVKTAVSSNDALELMLAEPASVLIVDLHMPGHDGFWLMERVHEKWPDTITIVASGADDVASVTRSRSIGAVDYVLKPFEREMLWQAMRRANDALERLAS
jgi:DNA-binding NtrC family response regulator